MCRLVFKASVPGAGRTEAREAGRRLRQVSTVPKSNSHTEEETCRKTQGKHRASGRGGWDAICISGVMRDWMTESRRRSGPIT